MKEHLTHPIFNVVSEIVTLDNLQAFVIGGYVRDLFLHRPSKDIDIVVVGSGIELANKVAKHLGDDVQVTVFKNFGTAMLQFADTEIEFVGARKESYQRDSRKPTVENGSLSDDQKRRDFTINTLALNLNGNNFGELLDSFDGITDLNNGLIKTPMEPNTTFSDDPLRMLRGIRFATQLNFRIEEATFQAICDNKDRIKIISQERIIDELNKIILSPKPSIGFALLKKSGLLPLIFPELDNLNGVEEIKGKGHKDNFWHTLQVLDNISLKTNNLWLRWAAILHDIAKPTTKRFGADGWTFHGHELIGSKMIPEIFRRMKLPLSDRMKYVQKLVFLHLRPIVLSAEEVTDSAVRRLIVECGEDIEDLMTLSEADITSKNGEKVKRFLANFQLVRQKIKEVEEKDKLRNWQPPITGDLIIQTFNLKPSRVVGDIKEAIRNAILDGVIENNYEAAYQYMLVEGARILKNSVL